MHSFIIFKQQYSFLQEKTERKERDNTKKKKIDNTVRKYPQFKPKQHSSLHFQNVGHAKVMRGQ